MIDVIMLITGFIIGFFSCIGILLWMGRKQVHDVLKRDK